MMNEARTGVLIVKMLVTGGAGFVGSNFILHSIASRPDIEITVVDCLNYAANRSNLAGVAESVDFVIGSITDESLTDDLVRNADIVVNFAAESLNDRSLSNPRPFLETNIVGTSNLLEAVRRYERRLHQVSSDHAFGDLKIGDPSRFTEETPYRPSSPYSATKASADMLVLAWVRSFGVQAMISNCPNIYGPRQHVAHFIPRQITNILLGMKPKVYGTGSNIRDWLHVSDHNHAVQAIIDKGRVGEMYLIGAECEVDNLTIVRILLRIMGKPDDWVDFVGDRPGHDQRNAVDTSKIMTELGWHPQYRDLEAGLAATVAWYSDNRSWWEAAKREAEEIHAHRPVSALSHRGSGESLIQQRGRTVLAVGQQVLVPLDGHGSWVADVEISPVDRRRHLARALADRVGGDKVQTLLDLAEVHSVGAVVPGAVAMHAVDADRLPDLCCQLGDGEVQLVASEVEDFAVDVARACLQQQVHGLAHVGDVDERPPLMAVPEYRDAAATAALDNHLMKCEIEPHSVGDPEYGSLTDRAGREV